VLQWDQLWQLKELLLILWVLMQWELLWEWKAWAKVTWVKPWVVLCKKECLEQWAELWLVLWQAALEVQLIWVQWATWVEPWEGQMEDLWAAT
jgi:hypothetical protein